MELLDYGSRALLLQVQTTSEALAWAHDLRESGLGLVDVVPGATTVVVTTAQPADLAAVRAYLGRHPAPRGPEVAASEPEVTIVVRYDGPDLAEVAHAIGGAPDDVIARHTSSEWVAAFSGFAPGFAYLTSDSWAFDVPRLQRPRPRIEAGSVAVAGRYSGVYPRQSPGGWHIIGHTEALLWDSNANPPALLAPGTRVRFIREGTS